MPVALKITYKGEGNSFLEPLVAGIGSLAVTDSTWLFAQVIGLVGVGTLEVLVCYSQKRLHEVLGCC